MVSIFSISLYSEFSLVFVNVLYLLQCSGIGFSV